MKFKAFENKLWLSSPTMYGEERMYVKEAFDTNWVSTVGENLNQLEKGIAEYVGCKKSVALSSGTSALHLAVKLAGVKSGDRVFCSDMTFDATVNPVSYEHAEQIFIDSETDTWNMDPVALKKAFELYPDTKAVIVANLYGTPAKLDEIRKICDENGNLLPDEVRLTKFGSFLRSTSLDELPELINILKGDMAFVGPRPLLVSYLPYYTEEEQLRHTVRPGLTGWAQVNGRNFIGWDNRLKKDVEYSRKVSFLFDVKILFMTFVQVVKRDNISVDTHVVEPNFAEERKQKMERLKKVDVV